MYTRKVLGSSLLLILVLIFCSSQAWSAQGLHSPTKRCTGVYVGKNLTADGNVLIGQVADESSSHWLNVVPRRDHASNETMEVGCNQKANLPGKRIEIPQAEETNRYITVRYSEWEGFPKPLENGGLNEHQVAVVDVFSPSRSELVKMTPANQTGLSYSDEARVVMQRAETAREGVKIIGEMIEKYGHATYGGNTHIIADPEEGWIVEEFAGGKGLWVAKKLGPNECRVIRPGYIGKVPTDYQSNSDYMGSDNLISFAKEQGWYFSQSEGSFNVSKTYEADRDQTGCWGEGRECKERPGHQIRSEPVKMGEKYLKDLGSNITIEDVKKLFRIKPIHNRASKYAQIAQLKDDKPDSLGVLWVGIGPIQETIFLPYYAGISEVPLEYRQHRYLTKNEGKVFMLPESKQGQETTDYAFRAYDRLFMLVEQHKEEFRPEVKKFIQSYEQELINKQSSVENIACSLLKSGQEKLASEYLTRYSKSMALDALESVQTLNDSLELRTKVQHQIDSLPIY